MTRRTALRLAALLPLAALIAACKKQDGEEKPAVEGEIGANQDAGY